MDFNDILLRVQRMYAAVNEQVDKEVDKHVNIEATENNSLFHLSFDKNKNDADIYNKVFSVIDSISKLKDHFKRHLKESGEDDQIVEDAINKSLHLQLIMDLSNSDKHTYPLKKTNRSGLEPKLDKIRRVIKMTGHGNGNSGMFCFSTTGDFKSCGDCGVVIEGEIIDKNGKRILDLTELISKSVSDWEILVNQYKII